MSSDTNGLTNFQCVNCVPRQFDSGAGIARSINLVDSVALPLLRLENGANSPEFWTQVGPNSCLPTGRLDVRLPDQTELRSLANLPVVDKRPLAVTHEGAEETS